MDEEEEAEIQAHLRKMAEEQARRAAELEVANVPRPSKSP